MAGKRSFKEKITDSFYANLPYILILLLTLTFILVMFYPRMLVSIHSGQAGVLWKRFTVGTVTDYVYPEGFYLVAPWNKMYVYDVRNQIVSHEFDVLTKKGLPVTVTLSIRYRPEYYFLGELHQKVGPDYLNISVKPVVEASIRSIIGQYDVEDVYSSSNVIDRMVNESLEKVSQGYVVIDDVLIRKITLPQKMREAIEAKLEQEQQMKAYEFILQKEQKEADRKRFEAAGIRDYQRIVSETLTPDILRVKGILATQEIAKSPNSKIVVIGSGKDGLPIILGKGD